VFFGLLSPTVSTFRTLHTNGRRAPLVAEHRRVRHVA
jgi:hypothetical protein